MNRREFIKGLGALAASGALAPEVAALLPTGEPEGRRVAGELSLGPDTTIQPGAWDVTGYSHATPIADIEAMIDRIRSQPGARPNVMVIGAAAWPLIIEGLREHHPELYAQAVLVA